MQMGVFNCFLYGLSGNGQLELRSDARNDAGQMLSR